MKAALLWSLLIQIDVSPNVPNVRASSDSVLQREGRNHWSVSVLKEIPPAGHGENTHSPEPSAASVNHILTAPPLFLLFISLFIFFFSSSLFIFTVQWGMLALQGGWCSVERLNSHVSHSSHVSPISYTQQREEEEEEEEGRRERGGVRKREERGGRGRRVRNLICFVHEWLV